MARPQCRPRLKYRITIYDEAGDSTKDYSEADILKVYWEHWSTEMSKKYGADHPLITKENCIDDWVVCHWAEKIT